MGARTSYPRALTSAKLLEITGSIAAAGSGSSSSSERPRTERVSLTKEAPTMLENCFPSRKPLNLVTIWGHARSGKSFLMKALLAAESGDVNTATRPNTSSNKGDDEDVFAAAGGSGACTVCALISTTSRTLSQISSAQDGRRSDSQPSTTTPQPASGGEGRGGEGSLSSPRGPQPQQPDIGFVDVEGQRDGHQSYETKLVTPLLFLSKVVIYDGKSFPEKATMLDGLSSMAYTASLLCPHNRENAFGHLIILLGDVPPTQEQTAYDLIFEPEDEGGAEAQAVSEAKARNEKRKLLKLSFQSTRVCCLPAPHPGKNGEREIPQTEVTAGFMEEVLQLRRVLATEMLDEPHEFGDRPIEGGVALATLLPKVCEAINRGSKNLVPLSMMESAHRERAENTYLESKEVFGRTLSDLGVNSPRSKAETTKILEQGRCIALEYYTRETQCLTQVASGEWMERLELAIARRCGACYTYQEGHVAAARDAIRGLVHQTQTRDAAKKVMHLWRRLPMAHGPQLKTTWDNVCEKLHGKLESDIAGKVYAYDNLCADLPALPTLSALKKNLKGGLDLLLTENRRLTTPRATRVQENQSREQDVRMRVQKQREKEEAEERAIWLGGDVFRSRRVRADVAARGDRPGCVHMGSILDHPVAERKACACVRDHLDVEWTGHWETPHVRVRNTA